MNLKAKWDLHSQGELRTVKGTPKREFSKSNLLGTTFTVSAGSLYHLYYNLLDIYFQTSFPFYVKKIQLKRRLLLLS